MKKIIVLIGLLLPSISYSAKYVVGNCEYRDYINTWKAGYFTLTGSSGSCTGTGWTWNLVGKQTDDWIQFSWGTGHPPIVGEGDYFGVWWKGHFKVDASGTYRFCAYTDDGVRMFVDGTEYRLSDGSDCWRDKGASHCSVDINLSPGYHYIEVQYCETGGHATAWFGLDRAGTGSGTCGNEDYPFPVTQIYMSGLRGEYYTDASPGGFTSLKGVEYEQYIGYNWGTGAPSRPAGMPHDYFSVRWTGNLVINTAGTYQFCVRYNDAARLIIDGGILLDDWTVNTEDTTKETAPISVYLTPGLHLLVLEFFESQGNAVAELGSPQLGGASCDSDPGTAITPIPQRYLAISEKACNPTSPGMIAGGGCASAGIKRSDLYLIIPVIFLISILIRVRLKRK